MLGYLRGAWGGKLEDLLTVRRYLDTSIEMIDSVGLQLRTKALRITGLTLWLMLLLRPSKRLQNSSVFMSALSGVYDLIANILPAGFTAYEAMNLPVNKVLVFARLDDLIWFASRAYLLTVLLNFAGDLARMLQPLVLRYLIDMRSPLRSGDGPYAKHAGIEYRSASAESSAEYPLPADLQAQDTQRRNTGNYHNVRAEVEAIYTASVDNRMIYSRDFPPLSALVP